MTRSRYLVKLTFDHNPWPNQDPLNQRFNANFDDSAKAPWMRVVGVVNDIHKDSLREVGRPEI